jgi:hypothetical protein
MRAKEFTINIPITVHISGDDEPVVNAGPESNDDTEIHQNPVMVPPLQQHIELAKAEHGKESPVIDKLTQDHTIGQEPQTTIEVDQLNRIKQLMAR